MVAFDYMEGGGTREKVTLGSRKPTELYAHEAVAEEMGQLEDGFYRVL